MPITDTTRSMQLEGLAEVLAGLGPKSGHPDPRARREAAIVAFGRRTIARPPLAVLMQDAVALVAEILGAGLAGATEVTDGGRTLVTTIASLDSSGNLTDSVSQQAPLTPVGSMAAFALTMANTVATSDLPSETAYQDMFLRRLGIRGALCVPIHLNQEPLGALGVFELNPRQFGPEDIGFAESISHLLAATMARIHAEDEVARLRQLTQSVLDTVDSLVINLDVRGNLCRMNSTVEKLLGFSLSEVEGKPFATTLLAPSAVEAFATLFREALAGTAPRAGNLELLAKDGTAFLAHFQATLLAEAGGKRPGGILLSGVGRTPSTPPSGPVLREGGQEPEKPAETIPSRCPSADARETSYPFEPIGAFSKGPEMRSSPRRTYQYRQVVAPLFGDKLPAKSHFFEVICQDISAGGFSFHLDMRPEFTRVVVGLGQLPRLTFFTADIVRVVEDEVDGRAQFLVGCRFTGRIEK